MTPYTLMRQASAGRRTTTQARILFLILLCCGINLAGQAQTKRYVKPTGSGANNGTSWANAYTNLQTAINACTSGDSLFVMKGTYQPASNTSYVMKNGVKIYGGFAGTETSLAQRILSTINKSILKGNNRSIINNTGKNLDNSTELDGFTLTAGGGASYNGGAINMDNSSGVIRNCIFNSNTGLNGGAVYSTAGAMYSLVNCVFSSNSAAEGGALYNDNYAEPRIYNCTFLKNTSTVNGGALYCEESLGTIINCIFWQNESQGVSQDIFNYNNDDWNFVENCYSSTNIGGTNCIVSSNNPFADSDNPAGSDGIAGTSDDGLRLAIGSTAVNAGSTTNISSWLLPEKDLLDFTRITAGTIDIGAYEFPLPEPDAGGIVYIDSSQVNTTIANGKSWSTATADLSLALYAARINPAVQQLWVAKGTYQPLSGQSFSMVEGKKIVGGFAGTETALAQRNLAAQKNSILKGNNSRVIDNGSNSLTTASLLDGFIITGGGMSNNASSPTISNCIFTGNDMYFGGGMYNGGSSPVIRNCIFANNTGGYGAAIQNDGSSPVITNCTFAGNNATAMGGALHLSGSAAKVTNCVFWNNTAPAGADINIMSTDGNSITYCYTQNAFAGAGNIQGAGNPFSNAVSPAGADGIWQTADDGLSLLVVSTAINGGTPSIAGLGLPANDIREKARVSGIAIDMGAYEYTIPDPDAAGIIYIDSSKVNSTVADGKSWSTATADLPAALLAARQNSAIKQLWIAKGTYQPLAGTSFSMVEGLKIYGGFAATETALSQRNLAALQQSILKGNTNRVIDNTSNLTMASLLDGFIITGGGMSNHPSSPTVSNCIFTGNDMYFGGGMYNGGSNPVIRNCIFANNTGGYGAAIQNDGSSPVITNCTFSGNAATAMGGALHLSGSAAKVTNCVFWNNTAPAGADINIMNTDGNTITHCYTQTSFAGNITGATNPFVNSASPAGADGTWRTTDDGLRLLAGSTAINAGTTDTAGLGLPLVDILGIPRIYGAAIDAGVYETFDYTADVQGVLYVNAGRSSVATDDGRSWNASLTDLSIALQAARQNNTIKQIWVATGTYQPAIGTPFRMVEGVKMYGGLAGTETSLAQRNLAAGHNSILKGNHYKVIENWGNNLTAAAVLDGFIITGGDYHSEGGGMYNYNSSPTVNNCIFIGNKGSRGGAVNNGNSSTVLRNCSFIGNIAYEGGAVCNEYNSAVALINCTIAGNQANNAGGALAHFSSNTKIINTICWNNTAPTSNDSYVYGSSVPLFSYNYTQDLITGTGNIQSTTDPFVNSADPAGADGLWGTSDDGMRMKATSAIIDAGIPDTTGLGLPRTDSYGNMRIFGARIDIGALEWVSAALPVKLVSFTGKLQEGMAYLQWHTADEVNFQYFTVEKSTDGISYQAVATVAAKGSNSYYTYNLPQSQQRAYYRLRMTDMDGRHEHSRIVILSQSVEVEVILIYPNPAKGHITISVNNPGTVSMYSLAGQLVKTQAIQAGITDIDISGFSAGTYLVLVNGKTIRLLKQ
ncbi:T9SS type A sorting domain-containing protein [Pseudoflavitalea sp. X16]|uniref:choice-of-anchor Q domain-containing protein n=1 Tax=Paraflavitalea devenefica TaxID=2716334 RepID=UPI001420213F|nr:choice-of-anchor Q domain-containing protein [Paraflavitalea devenefica]NII27912.1 T9SS type A sorting domain-containing protein [Paraflavitalea devenefica]